MKLIGFMACIALTLVSCFTGVSIPGNGDVYIAAAIIIASRVI